MSDLSPFAQAVKTAREFTAEPLRVARFRLEPAAVADAVLRMDRLVEMPSTEVRAALGQLIQQFEREGIDPTHKGNSDVR